MRMAAKGVDQPISELCKQLSEETLDYSDMNHFSQLLKDSISSILKKEEEKDVQSLFSAGGTTALQDKIKGIEDFKLLSFLIVKA